jgi:flagellar basal-body rod protein FlgC
MSINSGMFGTIDIATSGLKAFNKHMEAIGSNIANARTTNAGNGEPYRRIQAMFETDGDGDGLGGVEISDLLEDKSDFQTMLDPGHPDADENGYVRMPNVNMATEMISLNVASRSYQANAAMLKRYQKMVETSLDLLK